VRLETPEQIAQRVLAAGNKNIEIESDLATEEGLVITCKTSDDARRLAEMIKLYLPVEAHTLIEVSDRRVMNKWPEGRRMLA